MFTIPSLPKLFWLILIIAAVWYGFKYLGRIDQARKRAAVDAVRAAAARAGAQRTAGRQARGDLAQVEDTVKCRVCAAYVPVRSPSRCGRTDCPF
ncbi:MAG TPA: hypothetical protein VLA85_04335 [Verrucomicrobiae bacterium]|jgi:hypothetical protein|nr:hypothetical protein [Verrucomicrobiae bacterium]